MLFHWNLRFPFLEREKHDQRAMHAILRRTEGIWPPSPRAHFASQRHGKTDYLVPSVHAQPHPVASHNIPSFHFVLTGSLHQALSWVLMWMVVVALCSVISYCRLPVSSLSILSFRDLKGPMGAKSAQRLRSSIRFGDLICERSWKDKR